ncbi:MAG: MBL fold metallo-hydrolase [Alphaproteobacteria bacterium]|nr:MBL fold metallo-hydrolase [Alphaproteobacteria bacterium]
MAAERGKSSTSAAAARDRRQAEALRQNLKKRKEQARARADASDASPPDVTCFFHEPSFTATYLVADPASGDAAIIDSVLDYDGASGRTRTTAADQVLAAAKARDLKVVWILETHVHADHLSAAQHLKRATGAPIGIGAGVAVVQKTFRPLFGAWDLIPDGSQFDRLFADGDRAALGRLTIEVAHTPGHTPACVTYRIGDAIFVGDTMFMPDYGSARCDFPDGDPAILYRSARRLLALPAETRMFLCHDYKAPGRDRYVWETSVGAQRETNIHLKDGMGEAQFVALRRARDAQLTMPALILPSVQVNMRAGRFPPPEADGSVHIRIPTDRF